MHWHATKSVMKHCFQARHPVSYSNRLKICTIMLYLKISRWGFFFRNRLSNILILFGKFEIRRGAPPPAPPTGPSGCSRRTPRAHGSAPGVRAHVCARAAAGGTRGDKPWRRGTAAGRCTTSAANPPEDILLKGSKPRQTFVRTTDYRHLIT